MNPSNFVATTVAFASRATALQWILWALIMSLIMGWVARSRMRPRPAGCDQQMRHPVSTLIIGLAGFLLFATIAVISNVFELGPRDPSKFEKAQECFFDQVIRTGGAAVVLLGESAPRRAAR
jgi:hypothetical protein